MEVNLIVSLFCLSLLFLALGWGGRGGPTDIPFVADMYSSGVGAEANNAIGVDVFKVDAASVSSNAVSVGMGSIGARKHNLMAFNAMDNAKVYKGFTKDGKLNKTFQTISFFI